MLTSLTFQKLCRLVFKKFENILRQKQGTNRLLINQEWDCNKLFTEYLWILMPLFLQKIESFQQNIFSDGFQQKRVKIQDVPEMRMSRSWFKSRSRICRIYCLLLSIDFLMGWKNTDFYDIMQTTDMMDIACQRDILSIYLRVMYRTWKIATHGSPFYIA